MDKDKKKKNKKELIEWALTFLCAIALAVIVRIFLFEMVVVHQTSMYPTLEEGNKIGLFKAAYVSSEIKRGDIVVIKIDSDKDYVKRVIALEGETVEIKDCTVYINGEILYEEYVSEELVYNDYGPVAVPEGFVFVMGDNRPVSVDSRSLGFIDVDDVKGKIVFRLRPFTAY